MATSRFKADEAYALDGDVLQRLEHVARRLQHPALMPDERQLLGRMMDLILSMATRTERRDDEQ